MRGLVLAAGSGSRMGRPKALGAHDWWPDLVERAVHALVDGGCDGVTVVVGAAADDVSGVVGQVSHKVAEVVRAVDWAEGMGASLRAGLAVLIDQPEVDAALVTLVDLPDVGPAVVRRVLAEPPGGLASELSRAAYGGVAGHPTLIGRDHWAGVIEVALGDRGARDYFRAHEHRLVECGDLATGRDVDTPADLDR